MTEIKDILARALPEQPPATSITREGAVAAGRRAHRRRQNRLAAAGVAAVAVVLTAGVGLFSWYPGQGAPVRTGNPAGSPSATMTVAPNAPEPSASPLPSTTEPPAQAVVRLTKVLQPAARTLLPTSAFRPLVGAYGPRQLAPFEVVNSQGGYKAFAEISDVQGKGTFFMYLSGDGAVPQCPSLSPTDVGICETRRGPNGERITIETDHGPGGVVRYSVNLLKPDGSDLFVNLSNYSENDYPPSGNGTPRAQRPTPPMTVDEIVALLLTPGLTVYV